MIPRDSLRQIPSTQNESMVKGVKGAPCLANRTDLAEDLLEHRGQLVVLLLGHPRTEPNTLLPFGSA